MIHYLLRGPIFYIGHDEVSTFLFILICLYSDVGDIYFSFDSLYICADL